MAEISFIRVLSKVSNMADNHPAVEEIIREIPQDSKFGPNKIQNYNRTFFALQDHGYNDELNQLREQVISETRNDDYHHLPSIKSLCRMVVGLTGVDTDLERDLLRDF